VLALRPSATLGDITSAMTTTADAADQLDRRVTLRP
jgi:hypothetical protein